MDAGTIASSIVGVVVQSAQNLGGQLGYLCALGALFFVAERLRPAHREQRFFKKDFATELAYPLFNVVVTTPIIALIIAAWVQPAAELIPLHHVLQPVSDVMPFIGQFLLALLVIDIIVYVEHRFVSHGIFWKYHALHHMPEEVSWLTWARIHPINGLTIAVTGAVVHYVIGFEAAPVAAAGTIAGSIAIWEHSNTSFAWPKPLCYVLVSPRFHRWHHSSDAEAMDKNFCLLLPFLDLMLGTYYCPDRMPTAYGVHRASAAEPEMPTTFLGQLWYPFASSVQTLRKAVGAERSPRQGDATNVGAPTD